MEPWYLPVTRCALPFQAPSTMTAAFSKPGRSRSSSRSPSPSARASSAAPLMVTVRSGTPHPDAHPARERRGEDALDLGIVDEIAARPGRRDDRLGLAPFEALPVQDRHREAGL